MERKSKGIIKIKNTSLNILIKEKNVMQNLKICNNITIYI